jgi:hypothetical protein
MDRTPAFSHCLSDRPIELVRFRDVDDRGARLAGEEFHAMGGFIPLRHQIAGGEAGPNSRQCGPGTSGADVHRPNLFIVGGDPPGDNYEILQHGSFELVRFRDVDDRGARLAGEKFHALGGFIPLRHQIAGGEAGPDSRQCESGTSGADVHHPGLIVDGRYLSDDIHEIPSHGAFLPTTARVGRGRRAEPSG